MSYTPPIPVEPCFAPLTEQMTFEEKVNSTLWIAAVLTSRFLGQFPHLYNEADELFSVGYTRVIETIAEDRFDIEKLGAVCHVRCQESMERYANNVQSLVYVGNTTRALNCRKGKKTPKHIFSLHNFETPSESHLLLEVEDMADHLGIDLANPTKAQSRKLYNSLREE